MAIRYKITAIIMKPGNLPVLWTRYSETKMTQAECEKMFSIPKGPGRSFGEIVKVREFRCVMTGEETTKNSGRNKTCYCTSVSPDTSLVDNGSAYTAHETQQFARGGSVSAD